MEPEAAEAWHGGGERVGGEQVSAHSKPADGRGEGD